MAGSPIHGAALAGSGDKSKDEEQGTLQADAAASVRRRQEEAASQRRLEHGSGSPRHCKRRLYQNRRDAIARMDGERQFENILASLMRYVDQTMHHIRY